MPSRSTRRSFLCLAGAVSIPLAGCSTGKQLAHEVEVCNGIAAARTVSIRVRSEPGETLYHREFHLEADSWEEDTAPFTGTPASLLVTPDDGETRQFSWPSNGCAASSSAGGADVYLPADGEIRVEPTCDTVYATPEP